MYQITHTYLTIDDEGYPCAEVETMTVDEFSDIPDAVIGMVYPSGGRSCTTVAITVTLTRPVRQ